MRRYLLALALVLLLAADLGWKAWNERPYVVTAWNVDTSERQTNGIIEYRLPGGGVSQVMLPSIFQFPNSGNCWRSAKIGQRLPPCAYSWDALLAPD